MSDEARPCPFCGSTEVVMYGGASWCYMLCKGCEAAGPLAQTAEEALRWWNERVKGAGE